MIWFKKYFCFIPVLLIIGQLLYTLNSKSSSQITPFSPQNSALLNLHQYLHLAKINPLFESILNSSNEISFYLENSNHTTFPVIFSTNKDALRQVTALQKLLKIANIKGSDIKFIDLSSSRPYATF